MANWSSIQIFFILFWFSYPIHLTRFIEWLEKRSVPNHPKYKYQTHYGTSYYAKYVDKEVLESLSGLYMMILLFSIPLRWVVQSVFWLGSACLFPLLTWPLLCLQLLYPVESLPSDIHDNKELQRMHVLWERITFRPEFWFWTTPESSQNHKGQNYKEELVGATDSILSLKRTLEHNPDEAK